MGGKLRKLVFVTDCTDSRWPESLIPVLEVAPGAAGLEIIETVVMDRWKWVYSGRQREDYCESYGDEYDNEYDGEYDDEYSENFTDRYRKQDLEDHEVSNGVAIPPGLPVSPEFPSHSTDEMTTTKDMGEYISDSTCAPVWSNFREDWPFINGL